MKMKERIERGDLVKSTAGRDKNLSFIVIKTEEKFAYVVNGKTRKIDKPKKKNLKHIIILQKKAMPEIADRITNGELVGNRKLFKAIRKNQNF